MGQEFHVVRCVACRTFQVQQVKKVRKWTCKLCGEKQSLLKEFFRGCGPDCRRLVQKLNAQRGAAAEEDTLHTLASWEAEDEEREEEERVGDEQEHIQIRTVGSRWSKYMDQSDETEGWEENTELRSSSSCRNTRKRGRLEESPERGDRSSAAHVGKVSSPSPPPCGAGSQKEKPPPPSSRVQPAGETGDAMVPRSRLLLSNLFDTGDDFSIDL